MDQMSDNPPGFFVNVNMESPALEDLPCGEAAILSRRNPHASDTEPNEDVALALPCGEQAAILAIADGCGGHRAGDVAARLAIQTLASAVASGLKNGRELRDAIIDGFEQANRAVLDLGVGAMTTLSVVEIDALTARPYHVGDSTIMIASSRGTPKFQSMAHSPVGYAIEAGILDEHAAMHHEDRHIVSNLVGCEDMRIEVGSSFPLAKKDFILIGSDGLFDNVQMADILEIARKGPIDQTVSRLADNATQRMKDGQPAPCHPDDLTFVLYRSHATQQTQ